MNEWNDILERLAKTAGRGSNKKYLTVETAADKYQQPEHITNRWIMSLRPEDRLENPTRGLESALDELVEQLRISKIDRTKIPYKTMSYLTVSQAVEKYGAEEGEVFSWIMGLEPEERRENPLRGLELALDELVEYIKSS